MGITMEYYVEMKKFEITPNKAVADNGDITLNMIGLTWHYGLNDHELAALAKFTGRDIRSMKSGKMSGCFFNNVIVHDDLILLYCYDDDTDKETFIEICPREGIDLIFDIERGDGKSPDNYHILAGVGEAEDRYYSHIVCQRNGWHCRIHFDKDSHVFIEEERP